MMVAPAYVPTAHDWAARWTLARSLFMEVGPFGVEQTRTRYWGGLRLGIGLEHRTTGHTGAVCAAREYPEAPGGRLSGVQLAGGSSLGSLWCQLRRLWGSNCPLRLFIGGGPGPSKRVELAMQLQAEFSESEQLYSF